LGYLHNFGGASHGAFLIGKYVQFINRAVLFENMYVCIYHWSQGRRTSARNM